MMASSPTSHRKPPRSLADSVEAASHAYRVGGLQSSAKKAVRNQTLSTALGFEILGREGFVGAERGRRFRMAMLRMRAASSRRVAGGLLRRLVGMWNFALGACRSMMCLLDCTRTCRR